MKRLTDRTRARGLEPILDRVLVDHSRGVPGPLLVVVGGLHGNEPGGVNAIRRVAAAITSQGLPVRGRLVGLAGNLTALNAGVRYCVSDLNRTWSEADVMRLDAQDLDLDSVEEGEQRGLLAEIRRVSREHAVEHGRSGDVLSPTVLFDLHSSSAQGAPFSCMGDTLKNRKIALRLPVPVILGLEETIEGSLLEYLSDRGHVGVALEGGQHDEESTVDNLEAAVWLGIVATGMLAAEEVPDLSQHYTRLKRAAGGRPGVVELRYRHPVEPGDGFCMKPGFANFDPVREGQILAHDAAGVVACVEDGVILLPLYQGQGNDGFFIGREVRRFWLRLSAVVRRLRMSRVLSLLPGVRRHAQREDSLIVNPHVARFLTREVFHLLGYRQCRNIGGMLVFTRRREGEPLPL